jgi:hypothetical protein
LYTTREEAGRLYIHNFAKVNGRIFYNWPENIIRKLNIILFLLFTCIYSCATIRTTKEGAPTKARPRPKARLRLLVRHIKSPAARRKRPEMDRSSIHRHPSRITKTWCQRFVIQTKTYTRAPSAPHEKTWVLISYKRPAMRLLLRRLFLAAKVVPQFETRPPLGLDPSHIH